VCHWIIGIRSELPNAGDGMMLNISKVGSATLSVAGLPVVGTAIK